MPVLLYYILILVCLSIATILLVYGKKDSSIKKGRFERLISTSLSVFLVFIITDNALNLNGYISYEIVQILYIAFIVFFVSVFVLRLKKAKRH